MIRVDDRFASMGGVARVTLESETHAEAALERHAAAIRAVIEDAEAGLSRFRPDSELTRRPGWTFVRAARRRSAYSSCV